MNILEEVRTSALLGVSHVEAVLPLSEGKQVKLLTQARNGKWSVPHLKDEVKKSPILGRAAVSRSPRWRHR